MTKLMTGILFVTITGMTLLLTAAPAHAYKVIERRIEVNGMPVASATLPTGMSKTPVVFLTAKPNGNGTTRILVSTQPGTNGARFITLASRPVIASTSTVLTVATNGNGNGQKMIPVQVTIRERHRHRILGMVARHHWRARTETVWVPVSSNGRTKSVTFAMAM